MNITETLEKILEEAKNTKLSYEERLLASELLENIINYEDHLEHLCFYVVSKYLNDTNKEKGD